MKEMPGTRPFNTYFDHTLLKPQATVDDIRKLCDEAKEYSFYSVCVNSCYVKDAFEFLRGSGVKVTSVVGFPLGSMESSAKAYETDKACEDGAEEIDMVINVGMLKAGNLRAVRDDIAAVATACYDHDAILKVILETCLLTDEEIVSACKIAEECGAEFVKTSTGFASLPPSPKSGDIVVCDKNGNSTKKTTIGATVHDVKLMRNSVSKQMRIKASGGIHTLADAMALIDAGAGRLGCSASVSIMKEYLSQ